MNIFEIREDNQVKVEYIDDSPIFTIDNFYKYPELVHEYIFDFPFSQGRVGLWKLNQKPSNNGIYFEDRRFTAFDERLIHVYFFLNKFIGDYPFRSDINTNVTFFKTDEESMKFNNYVDNYWWPHTDVGWNGIVYFHEEWGTNLYSPNHLDITDNINEHHQPWRAKEKYTLLKSLEPAYNKLVLFDGKKFPHGMNVTNEKYFGNKSRNNQVFFFDSKDSDTEYYCV